MPLLFSRRFLNADFFFFSSALLSSFSFRSLSFMCSLNSCSRSRGSLIACHGLLGIRRSQSQRVAASQFSEYICGLPVWLKAESIEKGLPLPPHRQRSLFLSVLLTSNDLKLSLPSIWAHHQTLLQPWNSECQSWARGKAPGEWKRHPLSALPWSETPPSLL